MPFRRLLDICGNARGINNLKFTINNYFGKMSIINKFVKLSWIQQARWLSPSRNIQATSVQHLYAVNALGVDGYLLSRKRTREQFTSFNEKFLTKMEQFVTDEKNLIFTEDLKNMVHLAEPTQLGLVLDMIRKFNTQKSEFRFGSYVFGPVVMRMFHFLDAPKEALESFFEPANNGFYDQLISYQILLDLLYNNEMYNEMYKVFEVVQKKQLNMTKYPKYPVVLVLAACYKQNTPESLDYATRLWTEMTNVGTVPLRRACTYFAALALKQDQPHIALESLASQRHHYITIRNIKALALARMGRMEDVLPVLRQVLEIDNPEQQNKHTFFSETITEIKKAVEASDNKDIQREYETIEKALKDHGLIDNQTLDQLLNTEIKLTPKKDTPRDHRSRGPMPFGLRKQNRQNLS